VLLIIGENVFVHGNQILDLHLEIRFFIYLSQDRLLKYFSFFYNATGSDQLSVSLLYTIRTLLSFSSYNRQ
jgi:hypothetical protein